ncbi:uncharacterized protein N7483_005252 [Penicillium malachiteum]|uniref:uncharacterized protein n=1 Tax=Penicillium malachiteum TaxID=1324776 RepID=UPI0025493899|nr:uncharacterized protein N7483_005252 [Penicillium malachiteum]KAJ5730744.1 hypothetical protein N7483_005252 [Penicillium malachiteum]
MSLTRGHSCVLCQQRKVRCDQQKPCTNCIRAQVECKVVPPQPGRRKRRKIQEEDLTDRLKRYEALMTRNGVDFKTVDSDATGDQPENASRDELNPSPGTDAPNPDNRDNASQKK